MDSALRSSRDGGLDSGTLIRPVFLTVHGDCQANLSTVTWLCCLVRADDLTVSSQVLLLLFPELSKCLPGSRVIHRRQASSEVQAGCGAGPWWGSRSTRWQEAPTLPDAIITRYFVRILNTASELLHSRLSSHARKLVGSAGETAVVRCPGSIVCRPGEILR